MKIRYQAKSRVWFEWESSTPKEAFENLSKLQEVFDIHQCGCCDSTDLRFVVRENEGFQFYELRCNACSARLEFGQRREGGELFPKRRDEDGSYRKNGGWYIYRADDGADASRDSSARERELSTAGTESTPF